MNKRKISFFLPALEWFIIAFSVRLLFLIFIHFYSLQTGFGGFYPLESGSDDRYYFEVEQEILYGHIPQTLPNYYPYFLAFVFFFTGPSLFLGQLINVLAGSFTVYFGVLIAKEISSSKLKGKDLRHPVNIAGFFSCISVLFNAAFERPFGDNGGYCFLICYNFDIQKI
jgi:hypothetical protein